MANIDPPPLRDKVEATYTWKDWWRKVWYYVDRQEGWRDINCPIEVRGAGGATDPNWATMFGNFKAYQFTLNDECWFFVHIPHDYKPNTMIYPHVHWTANTASTNTVTWTVETSYARGYSIEEFPASTTTTITQAHGGVAWRHNVSEPAEGSGLSISTLEPDGILLGRCALTTNNLPVDPYVFYIDIHIITDGKQTKERPRPFTKI